MLTIWGRPNSHNVKKVLWLVEEIGLAYTRHDVGMEHGMDAAYLARNPNALVPTIEDDGLILWESNAILRYLAARHGGAALWPVDPRTRAIGDKWMDWHFAFADAQRDAFLQLVRKPAGERDAALIARSAEKCGRMMAILDAALAEQPWLSGDSFGIGDIPMGCYTHTWATLAIDRPARPHVEAWYARLRERSGFAAHVMIPLT